MSRKYPTARPTRPVYISESKKIEIIGHINTTLKNGDIARARKFAKLAASSGITESRLDQEVPEAKGSIRKALAGAAVAGAAAVGFHATGPSSTELMQAMKSEHQTAVKSNDLEKAKEVKQDMQLFKNVFDTRQGNVVNKLNSKYGVNKQWEPVNEAANKQVIKAKLTNRITKQHPGLIAQFGIDKVRLVVEHVATRAAKLQPGDLTNNTMKKLTEAFVGTIMKNVAKPLNKVSGNRKVTVQEDADSKWRGRVGATRVGRARKKRDDRYRQAEVTTTENTSKIIKNKIIKKLETHGGVTLKGVGGFERDVAEYLRKGWTEHEIFNVLRWTEEVNPDVDEDTALARMKKAKDAAEQRIKGEQGSKDGVAEGVKSKPAHRRPSAKRLFEDVGPGMRKDIHFNELCGLKQFGIVITGAGGELNEWATGIGEMLFNENITSDMNAFSQFGLILGNVAGSAGRTDAYFLFSESSSPKVGMLAMWRIKFGDCSWIDDFCVNFGVEYGANPMSDEDDYDQDDSNDDSFNGGRFMESATSGFESINLDRFEGVAASSADYENTEVDGASVIAAFNGSNCIAVYYPSARYASYNPSFQGDMMSFVDNDPFYPESDQVKFSESVKRTRSARPTNSKPLVLEGFASRSRLLEQAWNKYKKTKTKEDYAVYRKREDSLFKRT